MKLFTIGHCEMFDEVKFARQKNIPYFRTQEFSDLMLQTDSMLKKFASTDISSKTIYLTASGTAAMEAVVINCFGTEDNLLVINGGTFGQRFADICKVHGIIFSEIKLRHDEELTAKHFAKFENKNFSGLLVNLHETSTGQLYDLNLISNFCREKNIYLIVDAISSFLCDNLEMDKFKIDALITSSQKGVCCSPGMSIVLLNQKIIADRVLKSNVKSLYFDFKDYIKNFQRGQTPFTPAVGICIEINAALHRIEKIGLAQHLKSIETNALDFRKKIKNLPVTMPNFKLSNAITPILFEQNIAYKIFEILKNDYQIVVNPTGGELHEKSLRVSHIGNLTPIDNTILINHISEILNKLS